MCIYLFRGGFIFWLFFTLVSYTIVSNLHKSKLFPFILWGFSVILLLLNELNQEYDIVNFFHWESLKFLQDSRKDATFQWNVVYNMSIFRIISFGMDKVYNKLNKMPNAFSSFLFQIFVFFLLILQKLMVYFF